MHLVFTRRAIHPDFTIEEESKKYSRAEFFLMVKKWHSFLDHLGLVKGDVYAVDAPQSLTHFALFIAASERGLVYGAIPKSQYVGTRSAEFDPAIIGMKLWFTANDPLVNAWGLPCYQLVEVNAYPPSDYVPVVSPEDVMVVACTSGSTGTPKVIYHTHRSLLAATNNSRSLFSPRDRVLVYTSMNHVGTMTVQILSAFTNGCHCIICFWDVDTLLAIIQNKRPNKSIIFWPMLKSMMTSSLWPDTDLSCFDLVISGGAPLRRQYVNTLFAKGVREIANVYGSTEAPPPLLVSRVTPETLEDSFVDADPIMGDLQPGWECRVVAGRLRVRGVALGVSTAITKATDCEGFYDTADSVEVINSRIVARGRTPVFIRLPNDETVDMLKICSFASTYLEPKHDTAPITMNTVYLNESGVLVLVAMAKSSDINMVNFNNELSKSYGPNYVIGKFEFVDSVVRFDKVKDALLLSEIQ